MATNPTPTPTTYFGRELPLLTRESIPRSPRLVNSHPTRGPLINLRVLGFSFTMEAQEQWSRDHGIAIEPDDTYLDRVDMCWDYLPPDATVRIPNVGEDLGRVEDIEMIRRVQSILGATERYYPKDIW
ncbi:hypothetical protein Hypma_010874 [Hypsizygus marmoreus]|uniref:Uncharacterized protein n=1 Tax=Hypsizygus marmoreus TaxID=39966 RepID=A0A369JMW9_HYPMA|nr:hypothetical protein Hypma_010874 [Hypsizygus marmoreus]